MDITIGVIDFEKQRNVRYSHDAKGNAICYIAHNGYIYPNNIKSNGGALKVGETVSVSVNRKEGSIVWAVGDSVKHSCKCEMLSDQTRTIMPYIEMYNSGDIVEWS